MVVTLSSQRHLGVTDQIAHVCDDKDFFLFRSDVETILKTDPVNILWDRLLLAFAPMDALCGRSALRLTVS
jgi:hypothetical protein